VTAPTRHKEGFNYPVNGLRGLCVLLVFIYHVFNAGLLPDLTGTPLGDAISYFFRSFRCGVEMFFMISGYVIVNSLRRHANVRAFMLDRALRIFPAWIPVILVLFAASAVLGVGALQHADAVRTLVVFVANFFFLQPFVPMTVLHPAAWSISYEWVFYLMAGAVVALHRRLNRTNALTVLWGIVAVLLLAAFPRGLFFLPGVIIALSEQRVRRYAPRFRFPGVALLVFLVTWEALHAVAEYDAFSVVRSPQAWVYVLLAFVSALYFISAVVIGAGASTRALCLRGFQLLGDVSYSFYLWHPLCMFVVKRMVRTWVLPHYGSWVATAVFALLSFAVALTLSYASRQLIEVRVTRSFKSWLKPSAVRSPPQIAGSRRLSESAIAVRE
jgi:peptidoglycan/LPS O-acetylase OafA/YrhL